MNGILEEAVDEAIGGSSKSKALLLIAFVAGGAVALWLVHRQDDLGRRQRAGRGFPCRGARRPGCR
jgi:hypothetical protein